MVVVVLLCNYMMAQQTTSLKGIIVDTDLKGNITPIQGAFVRWMNEKNFVASDSNGVFIIPFSSQTKSLIVSYVGYKTDTILVAEKKFVKVLLITK